MKPTTPSEHQEQAALFEWAAIASGKYPELELMFAIPNGGKRHIVTAKKLKAEGVKPGVPDVCLPVARQGFNGMFIEMKAKRRGKVSMAQLQTLLSLSKQGHYAVVCRGFEDAKQQIEWYLNGK